MSTIRAFTITEQKNNPKVKLLKTCTIMRHSHISHCIWNTKIKVRLVYLEDSIESIIDMYRDQLQVPYIPNIKKGDIVTLNHNLLLSAWEIASKQKISQEVDYDEVRRLLNQQ
jgi:hypothetical protein